MRYLLDTSIVSAWARKSSSALMLKLAQRPPLAFCVRTLVAHELLYGFVLMPGTRAEAMTLRLLRVAAEPAVRQRRSQAGRDTASCSRAQAIRSAPTTL